MKHAIAALVLVSLAAAPAAARGPKPAKLYAPGNQFIYEVNAGGDTYLFVMKVQTFSPKAGYSFKWMITKGGTQGTLTVGKDAAQSAVKLFNYFSDGDAKLEDQTSALLSRQAFADLKAKKPVTLDLGDEQATFVDADDSGYMPIAVDRQYGDIGALSVRTFKDKEKDRTLVVLDNDTFPLILRMDVAFSIRLIAIL